MQLAERSPRAFLRVTNGALAKRWPAAPAPALRLWPAIRLWLSGVAVVFNCPVAICNKEMGPGPQPVMMTGPLHSVYEDRYAYERQAKPGPLWSWTPPRWRSNLRQHPRPFFAEP